MSEKHFFKTFKNMSSVPFIPNRNVFFRFANPKSFYSKRLHEAEGSVESNNIRACHLG